MDFWYSIKTAFLLDTGLSHDLAHVYAGVAIQLAVAFVCSRSVASAAPLAVLLILALTNEWFDLQHVGGLARMTERTWSEAARDIANTMSLPLILCLLSRFIPDLLTRQTVETNPEIDVAA